MAINGNVIGGDGCSGGGGDMSGISGGGSYNDSNVSGDKDDNDNGGVMVVCFSFSVQCFPCFSFVL